VLSIFSTHFSNELKRWEEANINVDFLLPLVLVFPLIDEESFSLVGVKF